MTWKGQVFCTEVFADALTAVKGLGALPHPAGDVVLPKGYGTVKAFVVTGPGEDAPQGPARTSSSEETPARGPPVASAAPPDMDPDAIRMKLIKWLKMQRAGSTEAARGIPTEFSKIDEEAGVPAGGSELHLAKAYGEQWTERERAGGHVILALQPARVRNTRGGNPFGFGSGGGGRI